MKLPQVILAALTLSLHACDRKPSAAPTPPPDPRTSPTPSTPPNPPPRAPEQSQTAAPPVTSAAPPRHRASASFLPSSHGFRFVNQFRGSPLPPSLRRFERLLGGAIPARFGLCGGMSALAADLYLANALPPDEASPPADGTPLYTVLYNRQIDSFGPAFGLVTTLITWMGIPDKGPDGLERRTADQLRDIESRLDAGNLTQLCLVLSRLDGRSKPWDNHQVLAYAYEKPTPDRTVIRIYDPNYPGDDSARLVLDRTRDGVSCVRDTRKGRTVVRGVFVAPYEPAPPPAILAAPPR